MRRLGIPATAARKAPVGIVDDREAGWIGLQEAIGIRALLVDVDGDHREAAIAVSLLHVVHPWKRAPARAAPRCPEVDIHDLAAQTVERYRLAACSRQGKRRRSLSDTDGVRLPEGAKRKPGSARDTQVPRAHCRY
jgi:hypothetical protein